MSETLSQIIAKMGTPAKPTGSTPKVPKEPKVPKVVQKARQTAVKRSPNPFVQAVEQAFKPTTPTKPQEPNLGQIIKQFKDVASSGRKQRGETLMQEYIRNTQPVSGNMGFKAGSGKGATIEAEMAAYDRKTFGAETYGKRPKGVSTAEWSKRQSHKGKFKQLAGTRNEQVAELDREIEAYKLENMTPVQRLELARETAGGLPGFYDKERASALAASLMGSQDLKDKTDASLFIRAANQVMQPVSTAYTVAMKDPRSLAEMPVGLQVGLSAGDLGAQIVGGFLTGGGSTPATASTLARIGAVATRSLALDAPGYIQMIEDAGGVDKALVAYKDMIGKALDPNSKISASERVNGIALAGMIVLSGGGKIAGKGAKPTPDLPTKPLDVEAPPVVNPKPTTLDPVADAYSKWQGMDGEEVPSPKPKAKGGKWETQITHRDYSNGENLMEAVATSGGKVIGRVDYSDFKGEIIIKHVEVAPEWRRKGVATSLYDKIKAENPGATLETFGTRTDEGAAFRKTYDASNKTQVQKAPEMTVPSNTRQIDAPSPKIAGQAEAVPPTTPKPTGNPSRGTGRAAGAKVADQPAPEPVKAEVGKPKEAWQMTRKEFSGSPRLYDGKINKDDGPKLVYDSTQKAAPEPFMGKYTIRKGPSQYVVYDGDRAIATYSDGDNLVVAKAYRKQGIATELLKAYKSERDPKPTSVSRTRQAQRVYDKAHRQIVQKALAEGKPVPASVLADYPDLQAKAPKTPPKEPVAATPKSPSSPEQSSSAVVWENTNDKTRTKPKTVSENGSSVDVGDSRQYYKRGIKGNLEPATNATPYGAKTPPGLDLFTYRETVGEGKNRKSYTVIADARTGAEITRGAHLTSADAGLKAIVDAKGVDAILKRIEEYAAKHGESPSYQKPRTPSRTAQTKAKLDEALENFKTEHGKLHAVSNPKQEAAKLASTVDLLKALLDHAAASAGEFVLKTADDFIKFTGKRLGRDLTEGEVARHKQAWEQVHKKAEKVDGEKPPVVKPPKNPLNAEGATGLARQFTDPERFARDLEETRAPAKSIQKLVDETQADWDNGGSTKADQALRRANDPEYAPTREQIVKDTAMVAHLKREVKNEYDKLLRKENLSGQDFADIQAVEAKLDEIDQYAQKIRTHWHDVGMALQIAYKPDFTVADLTMRARAAHGGDISPDAQAQIKTWVDKYEAAQKELDALRKAKPPKEVANVTVSKPRAARTTALNSLAKLGIEVRGEDGAPVVAQAAGGRMKGGKQAGAVAVPNLSPSVENQLRKSIRQIAKAYIVEEHPIAGSLDGVVELVRKHVPSLSEEDILRYLSDRYHRVLLDSDLQRRESQAFMRRIQAEADYRNKTLLEKGFAQAGALLNTTQRGLQASMDLSAPFRQGRRVMVTKEWVNAWLPSTKAMFAKDPQKAMELHSAELARSPYYSKGVESGLGISSASKPEEVWAGRLLQDWAAGKGLAAGKANPLRAYANLIQRSEAHYTIFLNDLRMRLFENLAKRNPNDKEYLESIAQMINVMTGRGHGKTATMLSHPAAGNVFYAPRYAWSEVQSTGMVPIWKTKSKMARQEAIKAYGRNFAVTVVGLSLARLFGNEVELDPRGTDFLKVRLQNGKVVDVLGASQQYLRLLVRMGYGSVSRKGFYSEPGAFGADPLMQAVNNKLSPAARSLLGLLRGWASPNADGDWQKQPPGMVLRDSVTPMGARKTGDQMWSDGDKWALLNLLGIDYEKGQPNKRQKKGSRPPKLEGLPQGMRQFAGHAPITGR